jgi:hypothetical protein
VETNNIQLTNKKVILLSIGNIFITALITSSINFYFSSRDLKDGKLIDFRQQNISTIEPKILEAKILVKRISDLISQINPSEIVDGKFTTNEAHLKSYEIISSMNKLVETSLELPYQMRHVLIQAHSHYFWQHQSKLFPNMKGPKPEQKNYSSYSFDLALNIAKENYILNGEPHHKELAGLITAQ